MIAKKASRAGIDQAITKMIRKSDKAPASFYKLKRVAKDTATDLKAKGKKLKIPWLLLALIAVPVLVVLYIIFTKEEGFGKGGLAPGEKIDEPVDLKGRDTKGLLDDFGYK